MNSLSPLEQDLSCPICCQIFNDPVILTCSHSFCRTCLQSTWKASYRRECPVCRQQSSEDKLPTNLALKNTCESYRQQRRKDDSDSQVLVCTQHLEKLNLFCLDDQKLVCVKCVSQDHLSHSFCSISKAASPHKDKIQAHLDNLEKKLQVVKMVKDISDQEADHIKCQARQTERQIKKEFEKLHQFLREEEEARLATLKIEEEDKTQRMNTKIKELDYQIIEISARIKELEEKLKDDALFLQDFRGTCERAQYREPDPELDSGVLIDVAKHLGNLSYRVWEKMKDLCPYYPVIFDPNTANPSLDLTDDLCGLSRSAVDFQLPDNLERMMAYSSVLGSEGFSSGTHSWEVDVEDSTMWILGVAEESVSRKDPQSAVPDNGYCCIWRNDDVVVAGISKSSVQTLMKNSTLRKVRVTLSWTNGQVNFYNMDNNTSLYSFSYTFTKKMYPYFYNDYKAPLKILPAQVSVNQLQVYRERANSNVSVTSSSK
ncbi:nuclear factor 7, brain-like [Hoplias malabaricus]|uniref:nuclear factor 7, brain-like n=1 Tax=Hoplias malabaricus TaxID=27720 RepID=UPI0034632802